MAKKSQHRNEALIALLAKNIREQRKIKGWTIEELAFAVGVDYSQIGRMERGIVNFNISILYEVSQALGVPIEELFKG
ncbi:MAG TPA: helix-turn-helix transcriptional regulator [Mucilaginibacter sp.]